jgi:WD40 repeat protein
VLFRSNKKLNGHEKEVKSLALFGNDLLASGSCDSTIKIWNLTTSSNIQNVTGHAGCVNSLVSVDYLNKTYLISASDDSTIRVWNSSFDSIETYHSVSVTAIVYDSLTKYVASGSTDNKINLFSVSFKLSDKNDAAHRDRIQAICVLKNGLIATGSTDATIKIWKQNGTKTLELVTTFTEHLNIIYSLKILSNGSLISGSGDRTIKVWNQINETSFECVSNLTHADQVLSLAVLNNLILSGIANGSIYVWNETSFQLIQILNNHTKAVRSIIALDMQRFASASQDGTIKIWRKHSELSFTVIKNLNNNNLIQLYSLAVLKNGQLVSAGVGSWISIWQKDTFELVKVLREHTNTVYGLAVLENGNFISVSEDKKIIIWDSYSLNKIVVIKTENKFRSVAIFLNEIFITGSLTGSISIWNTKSIDLLFLNELPEGHSDSILALKFINPVETNLILISASEDKTIKVWDMEIFKCIQTLTEHTSSITTLIPINQKSFASGSTDKSIKIWEYNSDAFVSSFRNVETISESSESIIALAVLNETKLVISSVDRYIKVFNKSIEIKQINELKGHSKSVQDIVVLDDNLFASCSGDKTILIWNNSIQTVNLTEHTDDVYALEYSRESNLLISGSKDTTIRLWNTSSSFILITTLYYHEDSVNALLILQNQTLISGSCDNKIVVWNLNTFRVNLELEGHKGCVNTLVSYNSDKYLVSGSTDTTIIIWDISNKFKLKEILKGHENLVNSVAIYQENIVSASSDKSIKIWSNFERSIEKTSVHNDRIPTICVLDDGLIVTGSYDTKIKIWRQMSQTLELVETLSDHFGVIYSLKCLSNQKFISSSLDQTVKIWQKTEKNTFECVKTINHDSQVTSISVLNNFIISGEIKGKINIWNKSSFELLSNLSGHIDTIWYLVSLNNKSFASASEDTTIKIWNQEINGSSFKCVQNLTEHSSTVYALAVLKEKFLASGCYNGLIKIWQLNNFSLIKTLTKHIFSILGFAVLDNDKFISVSPDKKMIIWDIETLTEKKILIDSNKIWSVSSISDDSFITGNAKGDLKIWSYFKEHKPIRNLADNKDEVLALVLLKNVFFASASQNGIIRVWDNNFNFKEINAHSKAVLSLNVFPNGTLISSSEDKSIKTWNTQQYILDKTIS